MEDKELIINPEHIELCTIPKLIKSLQNMINNRLPFYMYDQAKEIMHKEIIPCFIEVINEKCIRRRILFLYGDYNTGMSFLLQYSAALQRKLYSSLWKPQKHPNIIFDHRDDINTTQQIYMYLIDQLKSRRIKYLPICVPKKRAKPYWMMNKKMEPKNMPSRRLFFFDGILVGMSSKCSWKFLKTVTLLEDEKEK